MTPAVLARCSQICTPSALVGMGSKLAADIGWRIRLEVPHVDGAGAAAEPNLNDAGSLGFSPRLGVGPQQVGERQPEQPGSADAEKIAASVMHGKSSCPSSQHLSIVSAKCLA